MTWLTTLSDIVLNLPLVAILVGMVCVGYWVSAFFLMYHLVRFGIGPRPKLLALMFLVGSLVLFVGTMYAASSIQTTDLVQVVKDYIRGVSLPTL